MAINYAKIFNRRVTPQSQPIPGSNQVPNWAGGYSWRVDDWTRFDRFLILGAEGRSEEHTSELQSHSFISYAVFCLKKNTSLPHGAYACDMICRTYRTVKYCCAALNDHPSSTCNIIFFLMMRRPPSSTLFPPPPLFR